MRLGLQIQSDYCKRLNFPPSIHSTGKLSLSNGKALRGTTTSPPPPSTTPLHYSRHLCLGSAGPVAIVTVPAASPLMKRF